MIAIFFYLTATRLELCRLRHSNMATGQLRSLPRSPTAAVVVTAEIEDQKARTEIINLPEVPDRIGKSMLSASYTKKCLNLLL